MYGIMIMSIVYIYERKFLKSALCYAILLNFKHIFLYSAPAYGLLYLKEAVFVSNYRKGIQNFIILAVQTVAITFISFFPIIRQDPINILAQIGSRLFPFERGLVHSYMASNIWALYIVVLRSYHWLLK